MTDASKPVTHIHLQPVVEITVFVMVQAYRETLVCRCRAVNVNGETSSIFEDRLVTQQNKRKVL